MIIMIEEKMDNGRGKEIKIEGDYSGLLIHIDNHQFYVNPTKYEELLEKLMRVMSVGDSNYS